MCCVHTVGVHLGNEETEGGRGERELRRPESGAVHIPPWSFLPLSAAPLSKGKPTKWTHEKPKEPTKNHFSLISKSCHQGASSNSEQSPSFAPSVPEGLPGGLSSQVPGAAQSPLLQWEREDLCHRPPQVRRTSARPKREGKINSTVEATWRG